MPEPTDDSISEDAKGNQNPSEEAREGSGADREQVVDNEPIPDGEREPLAQEEDSADEDVWIPQLGKNG